MFAVLGLATLLKLPLWWYCAALKRYSGAAEALAEDHLNDVAANLVSPNSQKEEGLS